MQESNAGRLVFHQITTHLRDKDIGLFSIRFYSIGRVKEDEGYEVYKIQSK